MSDEAEQTGRGTTGERWDGVRVRRLREHLGDTQAELAERLGTRQQTVSEWETGVSRPRRMSGRLLQLVAEEAGFYTVGEPEPATDSDASDPQAGEEPR